MPHAVNPVDAQTIYFDASDTGAPPVLLLHGSALSRSIWRGLGYVKALEPEFDTIRMDLRGHGRSGKPHDPAAYDMDLVLADVKAVLAATGHESIHIVGYSFGSRVGLALAIKYPSMVRSLTMLGGTHAIEAGQISTLFFDGYLEALKTGDMDAFIAGMEAGGGKLDPATRHAFASNDALALAAYFEATEAGSAVSETAAAAAGDPDAADDRHPGRPAHRALADHGLPDAPCPAGGAAGAHPRRHALSATADPG